MGKLKKTISILFFLFTTIGCFAKQVSIQIIQHDSGIEEVSEQSFIIEDNLLNGLFDEGYIVTNSQAEISDSEEQDEVLSKKGIGEAFNGFSDVFIQVKLFFEREGSKDAKKAILEKADWSLITANTGTIKQSGTITNELQRGVNEDLNAMSNTLLKEIKKAIKA